MALSTRFSFNLLIIKSGINKTNSPQQAKEKLEYVIIVGLSGRVHRHKLK